MARSDFRGERRSNETHRSSIDPEARLARKGEGREARLTCCGNVLMEHRNGLVLDVDLALADGFTERGGALRMLRGLKRSRHRITLGGDKGYDTQDFVPASRELAVTPHVACNQPPKRRSAIDRRTTRHPGYAISLVVRRGIEQVFGWLKSSGGLRKARFRGRERTALAADFAAATYDLLRIGRLSGPIAA